MRKPVKWLNPTEAKALGFEVKPCEGNRTKARYSVDIDESGNITKPKEVKTHKTTKKTKTVKIVKETPFVLSAWNQLSGLMMDIDEYCDFYKLPRKDIKSYKLVSHTGTPFYNILFKENADFTIDEFDYITELTAQLDGLKPFYNNIKGNKEGVITLTDFHFGAYISAMNITPQFDISILCRMLNQSAVKVNRFNYKVVHVHILGDLIESFTGMNHKNSWKGLDKGMFGVSAIKLFVKLFKEHFLDLVYNLGSIKMVAGNHDRVTSDSVEDTDGGAAELIAYALELIGYDIEFKRDVLSHEVDGINYILNHGHLAFTQKKSTQEICWMYGKKGAFNFIMEGHLHSRIRKLNAKAVSNFQMVTEDSIDCRRQVCPSLFTGNSYSEDGGWSTLAGITISESSINNNGVDVYDISL